MRRHCVIMVGGLLVVLIPTYAGTDLPRTATKTFVSTHGWKAMYEGRRLVALIGGAGISKGPTQTAEEFVTGFPNANKVALGADLHRREHEEK